jgi:hypothetical protein
MKSTIRLLALLAVVAFAGLAAGCGGEDSEGTAGSGSGSGSTMEMDGESTMDHGSTEGVAVESPAADLRVTLDRLLGEHAILAMLATQKGFDGEKDFEAIAAALDENSVELANAIGSVYGDEARKEFLDGKLKWRAHIGFFVDYTVGLAQKDKAAQKKAVGNLNGYIESFSSFLAQATELPQDAVQESITEHVMQLKGQIDAYAKGDYEEAYGIAREAYAHMYMTGDTLAGAIVEQNPDEFSTDGATQSAVDLRVTLDRLLGEHALLAMFATQKGVMGEKDFEAIAGALDQNSVELGEAIGSVYGDEAGQKFLDGKFLWRDHIGFFVDYTGGLAQDDKRAQKKAVGNLGGYIEAFSAFLAQATELPQDAVQESITEHVNQLKGQIDAYAKGDYDGAYGDVREAYAHMFMTGDTLSGAIVKQSPEKFQG